MHTAQTATETAMHHSAALLSIGDEIVKAHALLSLALNMKPGARRDALIEQYETYIADLEAAEQTILDMQESAEQAVELGDEAAEAADEAPAVKPSLKRAMRAARKTGHAIVKGAPRVGQQMEQLVEGCGQHLCGLSSWCIVDETTGDTYRLTLAKGATSGVMRWWRDASAIAKH